MEDGTKKIKETAPDNLNRVLKGTKDGADLSACNCGIDSLEGRLVNVKEDDIACPREKIFYFKRK